MDEDEEYLPENSSLNMYLQSLGFSNVQLNEGKAATSSYKFRDSLAKSNHSKEVIDKNVIDQVEVIISTKLIFGEDISFVEILLSNFEVVNNGILKEMFQDLFGVVVIFLGLCLYFTVGYFALVVISPFYAYKCVDYFSRKNLIKFKLKTLTNTLKQNSSLLKKSIDFMKAEKYGFLMFQVKNSEKSFAENSIHFYYYSKFRYDFLSCVNEMTSILDNSTQKLIKTIPLIDYADAPEFYLCNNSKKNFKSDDPSKVYLLYLLVQSEFLKRLILSLIPNLNLSFKGNNCNKLVKIIGEVNVNLKKEKKKLEDKFYLAFRNCVENVNKFQFPKTVKTPNKVCIEEFISNIHNVSNTFMNLFLKCTFIEENITSEKIPDHVEAELVTLQTAINNCQKTIESCIILFKKVNSISKSVIEEVEQKQKTAVDVSQKNIQNKLFKKANLKLDICKEKAVKTQEEIEIKNENSNETKVKLEDLEYVIEDDVFEAFVGSESQITEGTDHWDLEEILQEKQKKEFSQNVMEELKGKLLEKAEDWKKREMNILKKKGIIDNNEESLKYGFNQVEHKTKPNYEIYCEEISSEKQETCQSLKTQEPVGSLISKNTYEVKDISILKDEMATQCQNFWVSKDFVKDLNDARNQIFSSPVTEEIFMCICDEDSDNNEE